MNEKVRTRILVVEDEGIVAKDIERSLNTAGYNVVGRARTGEEAIRKAREQTPDLVLMDISLAGNMSGITAAGILGNEVDVPVVFLTAHSDMETLEDAKITRPFGYLTKPFDTKNLASTIELSVYKHRIERELREKTELLEKMNVRLQDQVAEEVRRRLEKERLLVHQSKMAAMGEMVGAIAHQWRQPLATISMTVQKIQHHCSGMNMQDEIGTACNTVMKQLFHMSETIDIFLGFFRDHRKSRRFSVEDAVSDAVRLISTRFRSAGVNLRMHPSPSARVIAAGVPSEFQQAVLILLENACDAVLEHRERETEAPDSALVEVAFGIRQDRIILDVSDNGSGVPEYLKEQIFHPYFTTKGVKGTGIGLYICRIIIEEGFGGSISYRRENGLSVFRIEVPASGGEVSWED